MARTLPTIVGLPDVFAYMGSVSTENERGRLTFIWKGVEAEIRRFCGQNLIQPADAYIDFLPHQNRLVESDPLLDRYFPNTSYSSYHTTPYTGPQADGDVLPLSQGLVRSITEVRIDTGGLGGTAAGDFASSTVVDSSSYYLDLDEQDPAGLKLSRTGFLIRKNGHWPTRRRTVKVTYVAGLTEAELDEEYSDIRLNVCEEIAERYYNPAATGGAPIKSEKLGDWSVSYAIADSDGHSLSSRLRTALQPFVRYRL